MPNENRIIFLSVPESLRGQIESMAHDNDASHEDHDHAHNGYIHNSAFSIDPDIPIPVEIKSAADSAEEAQFDLNDLSWEMILSGMLHVIAEGTEKPEWIDYYRGFVLAVRPNIMGEFTEAAILKARNNDFDLALEILAALRGLFPVSPVVALNRALVLEQRAALFDRQGKAEALAEYRSAAAAYEELLELEPPFADALFNGGFFFLSQKDYSRAKDCFVRYAEIADTVSAADEDKKTQALAIIKEIDKGGLEDESFSEACALVRQGREQEGLLRIRDFLERYPTVWNGWFVLGWALRRLERWADGAAAFQKALELGGGNSDTRNELAICLIESGDLAAARRELEAALREDPENVKIISNLGVVALKNGSHDEAAGFFRTVLEIEPGDPLAREFLEKM
jgi:tetratricopeptide (TPR) repeat protein